MGVSGLGSGNSQVRSDGSEEVGFQRKHAFLLASPRAEMGCGLGTPRSDPCGAQTCHGTLGKSFPLCALIFSDVKSGSQVPWVWSMGSMGAWMGRVALQEMVLAGPACPARWI